MKLKSDFQGKLLSNQLQVVENSLFIYSKIFVKFITYCDLNIRKNCFPLKKYVVKYNEQYL